MDAIEGKLYSPFLKTTRTPIFKSNFKFYYDGKQYWQRLDATVSKIRISAGYPIKSFRELINQVAIVTLSNKKYEMFYRGQRIDYKDSRSTFYKDKSPKTIIYPAICRPEKKNDGSYKHSLRSTQISKRYDDLYNMINMITEGRNYHYEFYFALFQHYDILPTPLIDITQSLRVAASFALRKSEKGYIFVFGLPYPNQSISHFTDIGIVLVKLQNVCPVKALRPRYQEGYLVGKYPFQPKKEGGDNLARRLVAKFYLDNTDGRFWDADFQPMPEELLYPPNDKFEMKLKELKDNFLKKIYA